MPYQQLQHGPYGTDCVMFFNVCARGRKRLKVYNPISQDTTVIVLFLQPTFITTLVSLCQFEWDKMC